MRTFLQNLLIILALALCGLVAFQWHRETKLRTHIQSLSDGLQQERDRAQGLGASVQRLEAEVVRTDRLKGEVTSELKTNKLEAARLRAQLQHSDQQLEVMTGQLASYKSALETANGSIKSQNEQLQQLARERNEIVTRLNKLVADYNDLVKKWNEQQEQLSKQATNSAKSAR